MSHSDIAFTQFVQGLPVKGFTDQPVSFERTKHSVAGNGHAAAFLSPVLQRIQSKI